MKVWVGGIAGEEEWRNNGLLAYVWAEGCSLPRRTVNLHKMFWLLAYVSHIMLLQLFVPEPPKRWLSLWQRKREEGKTEKMERKGKKKKGQIQHHSPIIRLLSSPGWVAVFFGNEHQWKSSKLVVWFCRINQGWAEGLSKGSKAPLKWLWKYGI